MLFNSLSIRSEVHPHCLIYPPCGRCTWEKRTRRAKPGGFFGSRVNLHKVVTPSFKSKHGIKKKGSQTVHPFPPSFDIGFLPYMCLDGPKRGAILRVCEINWEPHPPYFLSSCDGKSVIFPSRFWQGCQRGYTLKHCTTK